MNNGEHIAWAVVLMIATLFFYSQMTNRAAGAPLVFDEDETLDDLSEDGSMGKSHNDIMFFKDIPEDDPLKKGEMTLEDFRFVHIPKTGGTFIENMFYTKMKIPVGRVDKNLYDMIQEQGDRDRAAKLRRHRCVNWHIPTSTVAYYANQTSKEWGKQFLARPKFTVVRHPLSRIISEYNYLLGYKWGTALVSRFSSLRENVPDSELCDEAIFNDVLYNMLVHIFDKGHLYHRDCHFVPQVRYITDATGVQNVRYVLRQEDLTAEMQEFLGHLGYTTDEKEIRRFGGNHRPGPCRVKSSDLTKKTMEKIISCFEEDFDRLNYERPMVPPE